MSDLIVEETITSNLIVGSSILSVKLIKKGVETQLKHSTYDLTIGEIFPIGAKTKPFSKQHKNGMYFLKPRQSVLVLSHEEFQLPGTITGLATLRTTLTKSGLLALNVGIIDPYYNGPISTTLINFSDRTVPIKIGTPFFRVLFMSHSKVDKLREESKNTESYSDELLVAAHRDFPKNFLDIPEFNNKYYAETFIKMIKGITLKYWYFSFIIWIFISSLVWYMLTNENYIAFVVKTLKSIKEIIPLM